MSYFSGKVTDVRVHDHAISDEGVFVSWLQGEAQRLAEENLVLRHKVEVLEEESALGFLKRKVKRWTHLKS